MELPLIISSKSAPLFSLDGDLWGLHRIEPPGMRRAMDTSKEAPARTLPAAKNDRESNITNARVSPATRESVAGLGDDREPKEDGVEEILELTRLLEAERIPCCLVAESALIYYGARRLQNVRLLGRVMRCLFKRTLTLY